MSFTNPFSTKTARVSTIAAAEVNAAGQAISRAVDGVGGGTYELTAPLEFTDDTVTIETLDSTTANITTGNFDAITTNTRPQLVPPRDITRVQQVIPSTNDATTWSLAASGGYMEQIANATDYVIFPLNMPDGSTLITVSAYVEGATGHGALPAGADRVDLAVYAIPTDGSIGAPLGIQADTSADVPTYEAAHPIHVTGLSESIDNTGNRYTAIVKSETGANYVAGLRVYAVSASYNVSDFDEGR